MRITLRRATTTADIDKWTEAISRPFHFDGSLDELKVINHAHHADDNRSTLAMDGGTIAGTFRSYDTTLTMPGGASISVDAITGITVQGTHRRRGVLTKMMSDDLGAAVDRGQPAAALWSAEYPIYGRFGFGVATRSHTYTIEKHHARFRNEPSPDVTNGAIRYASVEELCKIAPRIYEPVRRTRTGELGRSDCKWKIETHIIVWPNHPWKGWSVVSTDARGKPDGFLQYHVDDLWQHDVPRSTLTVDSLYATTPAAYERLWRFVLDIDLINTVKMIEVPVDDPLPWMLTDARRVVIERLADGLWLRPLDPVALLQARTLGNGATTLKIIDPMGFSQGVVHVEAGNVRKLRRSTADLTLDASTLGALILGTESPNVLGAAGRIDEHRSGAVRKLHDLLSTPTSPFCSTHF